MKQVQRVYQRRVGGSYVGEGSYVCKDPAEVEHSLLEDLIAKYQWKAEYVASIRRHQNYDGTCDYTVTYRAGGGVITGRAVYTIREH